MTTPPIQTLADELLGEIGREIARGLEGVDNIVIARMITELRTLRAQVKTLQSEANSWQSGYDEGRRMAGKHRLSEIEQLRAENAELRKDAGRRLSDTECAAVQLQEGVTGCDLDCGCPYQKAREAKKDLIDARDQRDTFANLLQEAVKTIHRLQAEVPTTVRIAKYLDAMRAKIDTAMEQAK